MAIRDQVLAMASPAMRMHESFAEQLTHDLDEAQMDAVPGVGLENTPRFTIGHLCCGAALTRWAIEHHDSDSRPDKLDIPDSFSEHFGRMGPADRRLPESFGGAPARDELIAEFRRQHQKLEATVGGASDDVLGAAYTWKLCHHFPRVADLLGFLVSHEGLHLGQVASWRRAMGLPAAMARMVEMKL